VKLWLGPIVFFICSPQLFAVGRFAEPAEAIRGVIKYHHFLKLFLPRMFFKSQPKTGISLIQGIPDSLVVLESFRNTANDDCFAISDQDIGNRFTTDFIERDNPRSDVPDDGLAVGARELDFTPIFMSIKTV